MVESRADPTVIMYILQMDITQYCMLDTVKGLTQTTYQLPRSLWYFVSSIIKENLRMSCAFYELVKICAFKTSVAS